MRNRRFTGLILAATFAVGALTALGSATPASAAPSGAAAELFDLMNAERAAAGLAPLAWRDDVAAIAVDWSTEMAASGELKHNDAYFSDETRQQIGSESRGENVAVAGTIARAHSALMNSPPHRAAILDPNFTDAGFGAVQDGSGQWWVTQNFLRSNGARSTAPASEPEPQPEEPEPAPVATTPPPPPPPTTAAPEPATVAMSLPDSPAVEWVAPEIAAAASSPAVLDRADASATQDPALGLIALAVALLAMTASGHVVHLRHRS